MAHRTLGWDNKNHGTQMEANRATHKARFKKTLYTFTKQKNAKEDLPVVGKGKRSGRYPWGFQSKFAT